MQDPKNREPTFEEDDQATTLDQNILIVQEYGIDEAYRFTGRIGAGGMGEVYRAVQRGVDRTVAVKLLSADVPEDSEAAKRFAREAKVLARLDHPNIVKFFAFGLSHKGKPYQIVDYLEGETLANRLERGPLSVREFFHVFIPIADALGYASSEGIVHRDVKPSNIFLCKQGDDPLRPVLIDFGITSQSGGSETITRTSALIGSPMYMSPEQCRGEKVDSRSDIYSLGCTMYEALSGSPPFRASAAMDVMFKHINNTAPILPAYVGGVVFDSDLSRLVKKCMDKSVERRPSSFESLLKELKDIAQTTPADVVFLARSDGGRIRRWIAPAAILLTASFIIVLAVASTRYTRNTTVLVEIPADFEAAQRGNIEKAKNKLHALEVNEGKLDEEQRKLRRNNMEKVLVEELIELAQWQKRHKKYVQCLKTCEEAKPLALASSEEILYRLQQIASEAHISLARAESDPKKNLELLELARNDLKAVMTQHGHRNRLFAHADYFVLLAEAGKLQEARLFLARLADEYRRHQAVMFASIPPTIQGAAKRLNDSHEFQSEVMSRDDRLLLCDMFLDLCDLSKDLHEFTRNEASLAYAHAWLERAIRDSDVHVGDEDPEMAERKQRIANFDALAAKSAKSHVSPLMGSRYLGNHDE